MYDRRGIKRNLGKAQETVLMEKWILVAMVVYLLISWRTVVSFYMWVFSGHNDKWLP